MSKQSSLKICVLCGGVFTIQPFANPKDRCPKCKDLLVP